MLIRKAPDIKSSEITPEDVYMRRREFLCTGTVALAGAAAAGLTGNLILPGWAEAQQTPTPGRKLEFEKGSAFNTDEKLTPWKDITTYNNYYEFGTGKDDPANTSGDFKTDPWSIKVDGECNKPGTFGLEDFIKGFTLEERIYRLRCVEAWSMVVPWVGIPMGEVLKKFEPNGNAKFVRFTTLEDSKRMWGQQRRVLDWPYVDGLRMDEAMNPLAIFVLGVYGVVLPNQNGAPIRMMAPWKYGFKNTKAIVRVTFLKDQFRNTWNVTAPNEYGFYANVNPGVPHPRWSQATELRLGSGFLGRRIKTLMFNGYADQVQHLYEGMDLKKNY